MQKILIVDDEEAMVRHSTGAGRPHNPNLRGASAGARSVIQEHHPQLMLVDINMPEEDGISSGRAWLSCHPTTGHHDHRTRRQGCRDAMKAGAYDYLTKPF
jgi:DNA-binding NtrC family response regulator